MITNAEDRSRFFGKVFNYANNPITLVGIVLTTIPGLLIVTFLFAQFLGGLDNPYIGVFAYVILPAIFVLGLLLIPTGMWRRRRKLRLEGTSEEELTLYPKLDFNDPQMRRIGVIVFVLTTVNVVILGAASFFAI